MTDPQTPGASDAGREPDDTARAWQDPSRAPDQGQWNPQSGQPSYGQPPQGQPYTSPTYGQPQYGQPPYGQAPYGQPAYGDGQYGQPQYGQPAYGQPQYGTQAFGQPPQYGQPQYGGPQQGDQAYPPQPGAAPGQDDFSTMARPARGRRPVLLGAIGGVVAIVVVVLVTAFWAPGFAVSTELSRSAAESGVKNILTSDYQATDVSNVRCPDGPKVQKGSSFRCSVTIAGAQQQVTVTFLDDNGTYEVGRPTPN
ncbi:DUF4333 domain-containing protein [Williamsia sp. SKLECPSW1]